MKHTPCANPKCSKTFKPIREWPPQKYCSKACQNRAAFRRWYDAHERVAKG